MSLSVQAVPYKAILLWAAYDGTITEVLRRRGNRAKPGRKSSEILGVEINPFRSLRGFERNREWMLKKSRRLAGRDAAEAW
jgi:hypothetical protein